MSASLVAGKCTVDGCRCEVFTSHLWVSGRCTCFHSYAIHLEANTEKKEEVLETIMTEELETSHRIVIKPRFTVAEEANLFMTISVIEEVSMTEEMRDAPSLPGLELNQGQTIDDMDTSDDEDGYDSSEYEPEKKEMKSFDEKTSMADYILNSVPLECDRIFADRLKGLEEDVIDQVDAGIETLISAHSFITKLVAAEKEFSKTLAKLASDEMSRLKKLKPHQQDQMLTSSQSWKHFVGTLKTRSQLHMDMSTNLSNLLDPLEELQKEEHEAVSLIKEKHKEIMTLTRHMQSEVATQQEKCTKLIQEYSNAGKNRFGISKTALMKKLKNNLAKYGGIYDTANSVRQTNWHLDLPLMMCKMQGIEEKRIKKMQDIVMTYGTSIQALSDSQYNLSQAFGNVALETDLSNFATLLAKKKDYPDPKTIPVSYEWGLEMTLKDLNSKHSPMIKSESVRRSIPDIDLDPQYPVPKTFTFMIQALIDLGGLSTEGIFRVAGDHTVVEQLFLSMSNGQLTVDVKSPHDVAALFKKWIREFYQPLLPITNLELIKAILLEQEQTRDQLQACRRLEIECIGLLPVRTNLMVQGIVLLLRKICSPEYVEINKMHENNLATVFGPIFIYDFQQMDPARLIELSKIGGKVLMILLTHMVVNDYPSDQELLFRINNVVV